MAMASRHDPLGRDVAPVDGLGRRGDGPRDADLVAAIAEQWSATFGQPFRPDDDFFALGGDTAEALALAARLRDHLGLAIAPDVVLDAPTPTFLAAQLALAPQRLGDAAVELSCGPGPTLFLLPAGGGETAVYAPLVQRLGRRCVAVVPPGLDERSRPLHSIGARARYAVRALRGVQPRGPYVVAGFSSGAAEAYEVAGLLQAAGEEVALAVLLDPVVPVHGLGRLHETLRLVRSGRLRKAARRLLLPLEERRRDVRVALRSYAGRPLSLAQVHLRMEAATRRALVRYRPRRHGVRLLVVRATDDRPRSFQARSWPVLDAAPHLDVHAAHLGSRGLMVPPQVDDLAAKLAAAVPPARP